MNQEKENYEKYLLEYFPIHAKEIDKNTQVHDKKKDHIDLLYVDDY